MPLHFKGLITILMRALPLDAGNIMFLGYPFILLSVRLCIPKAFEHDLL